MFLWHSARHIGASTCWKCIPSSLQVRCIVWPTRVPFSTSARLHQEPINPNKGNHKTNNHKPNKNTSKKQPPTTTPSTGYQNSLISEKIWTHLESIDMRHRMLEEEMRDGIEKGERHKLGDISRELKSLQEIVDLMHDVKAKHQEISGLQGMLAECKDKDLLASIKKESQDIANSLPALETELLKSILPKHANDQGNATLEIRAGAGGSEAQLFAKDIFEMYHEYAHRQRWRFQIVSMQHTESGGYREAVAEVSGRGVYGHLKFESGVHRVQRVPETETMGRTHTSTITVAVLPEAKTAEVTLNAKDIRVDVYRASGPGGQSVNTTDSAVRLTHIPSGLVVTMQDERSQIQNKEKAMQILRTRLHDLEHNRLHEERSENRASQVGSGERMEKIRTYNFSQNRVTDHRVGVTSHSLDKIISGEEIADFIDEVVVHFEAQALEQLTKGEII